VAPPIKKIRIRYFPTAEAPILLGEYPLDEDSQNVISFSHEWWRPAQEMGEFVHDVFESMDVNYVTAGANLGGDLLKLFGASIKPLNYFSQAWKGPSSPFSINISLLFRFGQNGKYDSYSEVVKPTLGLITHSVPVFATPANSGTFVYGPGPKALDIISTVTSQLTGIQALLPGKGDSQKKLRDFEAKSKAEAEAYSTYTDILKDSEGRGLTDKEFIELNKYVEEYPEIKRYYEALRLSKRDAKTIEAVDAIHRENKAELELEREILKSLSETPTYQVPRTWELTFGGYLFKYLVCTNSIFTFDPEVDESGFPIRSNVSLTFQPYLIALANSIGSPNTGEKIKDSNVTYGWSKNA